MIVSFSESLTGGGEICTEYSGIGGTLASFNVSFYFNSNGDSKWRASDMYILIQASGTKCYTYGGFDDDNDDNVSIFTRYYFFRLKCIYLVVFFIKIYYFNIIYFFVVQ